MSEKRKDTPRKSAPKNVRPADGTDTAAKDTQASTAAQGAATHNGTAKELGPKDTASVTPNSAATAALALAVTSARKAAGAANPQAKAPAPAAVAGRASTDWRRHGAQAAALVLALGLGWFGGSLTRPGYPAPDGAAAWAEAATGTIRQSQEDVVRLAGDIKALKVSVETLRDGLDRQTGGAAGKPVLDRLDRAEHIAQDTSAQMARLGEQLERLEHAQRDPSKTSGLGERLERIERQVAATASTVAAAVTKSQATASVPAPDPVQTTGSVPGAKPDPKQTTLEGWALREVYDGIALVESRNNRLHEVAPGQVLPGVGRIEAIERRGKAWVVVTDKGLIGQARW